MGTKSNLATVRAFYDGLQSDDVEPAIVEFLDPDVVWENTLPECVPYAGRYRGLKEAARYLGLILGAVDMESLTIREMIAEDDTVVVVGHETSVVKRTGRRFSQTWVHVLRLRSGRIQHLREHNDGVAMLAAFL